jgi:hypothetical protein
MLPDELKHYGKKGMRWGVRQYKKTPSEVAITLRQKADKDEAKAAKIKDSSVSKGYAKQAERRRRKADLLDRYAKSQEKQPSNRRTESFQRTYNQPYHREDQRRNQNTFERAAKSVATKILVGVAVGATMKVIGPTAEAFGASLKDYLVPKKS